MFQNFLTNFYNLFYSSDSQQLYYLSLIEEDNNYSIHGLWPQYNKNKYPTYCKKVIFSLETLNPIMDKLNKYWYSKTNDNPHFWKHEYEKHGSCMFLDMTELEYFTKTIELYEYCISEKIKLDDYSQNNKILVPFDKNFNLMT
jgi:ribonuclease I